MRRDFRVAWDNTLALNDPAGTGVYARRLPEALELLGGMTVKVIAAEAIPGRNLMQRGKRFVRGLCWTHYALPRVLEKEGFDVLHSPAFIAPTSAPCPVVVTIHDVSYRLFPAHFAWWWAGYLRSLMPKVLQTAAGVITVSEHSKRDIVSHHHVAPEKVHVVYNGVDHKLFHPNARLDCGVAKRLALRPDYVLHVGSLAHRKNIPTILRAVAQLKRRGKWGIRQLVLVGPQMRSLRGYSEIGEMILELGLETDVVLTGYLEESDIPGIYAGARVLVMASTYEGFGFPLVEAMAVGTPVVASNVSSIPEVCDGTALLFDPHSPEALAEAIDSVLTDSERAQEMRQNGWRRAQEFTWQKSAEQTAAVYRHVLSS